MNWAITRPNTGCEECGCGNHGATLGMASVGAMNSEGLRCWPCEEDSTIHDTMDNNLCLFLSLGCHRLFLQTGMDGVSQPASLLTLSAFQASENWCQSEYSSPTETNKAIRCSGLTQQTRSGHARTMIFNAPTTVCIPELGWAGLARAWSDIRKAFGVESP